MAEDKRLNQNEGQEENVQKETISEEIAQKEIVPEKGIQKENPAETNAKDGEKGKDNTEKTEQKQVENKQDRRSKQVENKQGRRSKQVQESAKTKEAKEKAPKVMRYKYRLPTRSELEFMLKKNIIGQDEFIKQVTVAVYRRYQLGLKSNVMVLGDSGSGKTATLKLMAQMLGLPYTIESATEYTQSGYVGKDLDDIVNNLLSDASSRGLMPLLMAGYGIVIIDEIDKKAERDDLIGHSVSGKAVQQRLLKFIEGMNFPIQTNNGTFNFSTENLMIICMGAFEDLDRVRKERKRTNGSIGFSNEEPKEESLVSGFIEQDFIEYGLIKEFIGRFDCIAKTKTLTQKDLKDIILYSGISAFREYENVLKRSGIEVRYSMRMIEKLAERSFLMKIGARAIKNVVNYVFENIFCDLMDTNYGFKKCTLDDEIVYDNTRYILE